MRRLLLFASGTLAILAAPARAQVIAVNTFADTFDVAPGDGLCEDPNGLCSLRAAIMEANAVGGAATILLQSGTYLIQRSGGGENDCVVGDLDILDHLTIAGSTAGLTVIDGNGLDRVFDIYNGAAVELRNMVITGGDPGIGSAPGTPSQHGGGIRVVNGHLRLSDVVLFGNRAFVPIAGVSNGGGIYVAAGSFEMSGGEITHNESSDGNGGGLYLAVQSVLGGVTIRDNSASSGGGGVTVSSGGVAVFDQVRVLQNTSNGDGGGIRCGGTVRFLGGEIHGNSAAQFGGGISSLGPLEVVRSRITSNDAGLSSGTGSGGGISSVGGHLIVVDTTIEGNSAAWNGGGISTATTAEVRRSTISGNTASTALPLPGAVIGGGGIHNTTQNGRLTIVNSTISYNRAAPFGHGGGIANDVEGTVELSASTLAFNQATVGNSLYNGDALGTTSSLVVIGSILDDTPDPGDNVVAAPASPITDQGFTINVDGTGMTPGPGSLYGTPGSPIDTRLGPLGPNGGLTLTHSLQPGSPAIDAFGYCADLAGNVLGEDQRGSLRPEDGDGDGVAVCDIGAFEAPAASPPSPWRVTILHPAGATFSRAQAIHGIQQAGQVAISNTSHASRWEGAPNSWVDVHPAGATLSVAYAVHSNRQVGDAILGSTRAGIWSGTAGSHVDLHGFLGAGYSRSHGRGVWVAPGGLPIRAVGFGDASGSYRAAQWLWNGTAWTAEILHPAGMNDSRAFAVHGNQVVGHALGGGISRASLWTGSAGSWLDLNPFLPPHFSGPGEYAQAEGIWSDGATTTIVGWAQNTVAGRFEAVLWSGSGALWASTELHPSVASESRAVGVYRGTQVGTVSVGGIERASLWSSSAASWEDLHQHLPAQYHGPGAESAAHGVWDDGTTLFVVGEARNPATLLLEAVMWVRTSSPYVVTAYCPGDGSFGVDCPHGATPGLPGNNNDGSNGIAGCASSASPGGATLRHTVSGLDITLGATHIPAGPRLWLQGSNAIGGGNGLPLLDGLRCVGGGVVRLEVQGGAAPPTMSQPLPPGAPGQILRYQLWYRDSPAALSGANLSNGLQIVW